MMVVMRGCEMGEWEWEERGEEGREGRKEQGQLRSPSSFLPPFPPLQHLPPAGGPPDPNQTLQLIPVRTLERA